MEPILEIRNLTKTYKGGFTALRNVDLDIRKGEIFALLGPNGAGKTTLIGAVCGLVRPTGGTIRAFGEDMHANWRTLRARIGLVPQELATDMFEPVLRSVTHSRGLFGLPPDPARIEGILKSLSLWDKREVQIRALSGGMKRRVLIAKAMAHEPELLFLDEPTAGVDVELRRDMWKQIAEMRERGTTVILTTHYIEEAEEMADRVGIIRAGEILMVDDKDAMMKRMGRTEAHITLAQPIGTIPEALSTLPLTLSDDGTTLTYRGGDGAGQGKADVAQITKLLTRDGIDYVAIDQHESSLEDIFVTLVEGGLESGSPAA
ncbi:ABC-2 type transport system ATP-binding protein [Novosphingobium chloroacetimidivorans]|uniref:ABC-2 type transport system ATP-binding protein n=1 Tax=Novosphingobium chloroacetimidivorans TaxID=1428314 RepID=A0A7W7K7G2_9SPHN|nr:ABC transporter ATP-binding protein [Novosphingobium chloroacetimidivorans]MBB4857154.1 ABC-2 type transport system ATP-binding protein [Novosphingobium chloroacetimidivorans]